MTQAKKIRKRRNAAFLLSQGERPHNSKGKEEAGAFETERRRGGLV